MIYLYVYSKMKGLALFMTHDLSENVKIFVQNTLNDFISKRDFKLFQSVLHPSATFISTDNFGVYDTREEIDIFLLSYYNVSKKNYDILEQKYNVVMQSESCYLTYGQIKLRENNNLSNTKEISLYLTILCEYDGEQFWITHFHISKPIDNSYNKSLSSSFFTDNISDLNKDYLNSSSELVLNSISGGVQVCKYDERITIIYLSLGFADIIGCSENNLNNYIGKSYLDFVYKDDIPIIEKEIPAQLKYSDTFCVEYRIINSSNEAIWVMDKGSVVIEKNGERHLHCIVVDISARKKREEINRLEQLNIQNDLRHKAEHDEMTGLISKTHFDKRVNNFLRANPYNNALLIIDIDKFKQINDNFGHRFGDTVLIDVSDKLKSVTADSDFVGRIGGDEFGIFLKNIPNADIALEIADNIRKKLICSYSKNNSSFSLSVSIGVAFTAKSELTYRKTYELADKALYVAKNNGRNQIAILDK